MPPNTATPHPSKQTMPSKANIYGHPIHPMLVAFPIVFFIMALIADVVYEAGCLFSDWSQFAYISLIGGIATAIAAAITGLIEYSIIEYVPFFLMFCDVGRGVVLRIANCICLASRRQESLTSILSLLFSKHIPSDEEPKKTANAHMTLNVIVLILQAVNLSFRGHAKGNHYWRHGWILSLVSVVLLAISGWLGGELVYKYRYGVRT